MDVQKRPLKRKRSPLVPPTPQVTLVDLVTKLLDVAREYKVTEVGYEIRANPGWRIISKIYPSLARMLSATLRYIAWDVAYTTKSKHQCESYSLKHAVERFSGQYVSNGAAVLSFHLLGFEVNKVPNNSNGSVAYQPAPSAPRAPRGKKEHMHGVPKNAVQKLVVHYIACSARSCKCLIPTPLIGLISGYLGFTVKVTPLPAFVHTAFQLADQIEDKLW